MPSKKKSQKNPIFQSIKIGKVVIKNRFARSATHEWLCEDDGTPKPQLGGLLETLAKGGVGLIMTGYAYVNPRGQASKGQNAIYNDELIEPHSKMVERVHRHGAKIFLQIVHGGRQAEVAQEKFHECLAPSAVPDLINDMHPRQMSVDEILATIVDFVSAARRAKAAGYDGVQLHVAHGFLLSSFISPHTNRRTDEWGGNLENRARIIVEIIRGIRDKVGPDFPVIAKINATDGFSEEGKGLKVGEAADIAKILAAEGLKAIEVSAGIWESETKSSQVGIVDESSEGYFLDYAVRIKSELDIPVLCVGGFRSLSVMNAAITDGKCDMISISRPFIREPDLINKFQSGKSMKAECISCNKCFNEKGVRCHYRTEPVQKENLPVLVETAMVPSEKGKKRSLPMATVSGLGVIQKAFQTSRSNIKKRRSERRKRIMAIRKPLKKIIKRVKKLRPLKRKLIKRPSLKKAFKPKIRRKIKPLRPRSKKR